jgi:hypothetical protein
MIADFALIFFAVQNDEDHINTSNLLRLNWQPFVFREQKSLLKFFLPLFMGLNVISASSDERTPDERKKIFFIEVVFKGRFKLFYLDAILISFSK